MEPTSKIFVAGHQGLVGSAVVRAMERAGYRNLTLRTSAELDLRNQQQVESFFSAERPEYVVMAAAKVGGILANSTRPAEFIRDNLQIQTNVIDASHRVGVKKFCFLGSSCIYPRLAAQPIREDYLLSGPLEPTNQAYAIAKIAGLEMVRSFRTQYGFNGYSLMPTNLYGPGDNFDLNSSHVLPALIRRFHEAKVNNSQSVTIWGTGTPLREFLYVDDLASAVLHTLLHYEGSDILNVGLGHDIAILDLAKLVASVVGYQGEIALDLSKPDGTPRKLLDISRIKAIGWQPQYSLEQGVRSTYDWFVSNHG